MIERMPTERGLFEFQRGFSLVIGNKKPLELRMEGKW
jgi:hypothetical protein